MSLNDIVTYLNMNLESVSSNISPNMVNTIQPGMIESSSIDVAPPSTATTTTATNTGIDWVKILRIVAIVVILAFLGIKLFSYVGDAIVFI